MILPCECPSTAHCLEATGGEQGESAEMLEVARLRRELGAATDELGTLRLRCEDYRLDAVAAREERDELRREAQRRDAIDTTCKDVGCRFVGNPPRCTRCGRYDRTSIEVALLREERGQLAQRLERAERERDRLATDALCALVAAGIATPERGYVVEPACLSGDIAKLARERDAALARLELVEDNLCSDRRSLGEVTAERDEATTTLTALKRRVTAELSRIEREFCSACGNGRGLVGRLAEDVRSILSIEPGEDVARLRAERDAYRAESASRMAERDDLRRQLWDRRNSTAEITSSLDTAIADIAAYRSALKALLGAVSRLGQYPALADAIRDARSVLKDGAA